MGGETLSATGVMETGPTKLIDLLSVSLRKVSTPGPMIPSITAGRNLFPKQN
jgi:hypothetical protein